MNNKSNMKPHVKAGISFGTIMGILIIASYLLFPSYPDGQPHVARAIITGILSGVFAGCLFGWMIGKFSKSKFIETSTKIETIPGENMLMQGPANHFKSIEAVGGKLYLTSKRLIFKSHKLNIQNHTFEVLLDNIIRVEKYKPLGISNNGLLVTTSNGKEKFVVQQVEEWIELIEKSFLKNTY